MQPASVFGLTRISVEHSPSCLLISHALELPRRRPAVAVCCRAARHPTCSPARLMTPAAPSSCSVFFRMARREPGKGSGFPSSPPLATAVGRTMRRSTEHLADRGSVMPLHADARGPRRAGRVEVSSMSARQSSCACPIRFWGSFASIAASGATFQALILLCQVRTRGGSRTQQRPHRCALQRTDHHQPCSL